MHEPPAQLWRLPRRFRPLADDVVHVWSVRLDLGPERVQQLLEVLSPDERERGDAFRFAYLRRRHVVARGVLRQLLGAYLTADPSSLRFHVGPFGKPSVLERLAGMSLSFNVSHSAELALIAVARGRELGVDVEHVRAIEDADAIAERYFCAPERDELRSSQGHAKTERFFTYWTRKEALLKATGDGLSLPLDRVDVSIVQRGQSWTIPVLDGSRATRHLTLVDLKPAVGYAGALAVEGAGWRHVCWRWPEDGHVR